MIVSKPTKKKKISRYTVLSIIMLTIFAAITLRLLYLQVFNYNNYKEKADTTSTRFLSEVAPRGKIYDTNGTVLATNKQTYAITYTKPDNEDEQFYTTINELFKILDENGENIQDALPLKIDDNNKVYFQYSSSDKQSQNAEELRIKKDRGLNDTLKNQDKSLKDVEELSDAQSAQLDAQLLKITPEETFYELVKSYNLIGLVDPNYNSKENKAKYSKMTGEELTNQILQQGYSLKDIRKYMLVKDAIKMQSFKGYKSVTIAQNIKKDTAFILYQKKYDLPGIDVKLTPIRYYPFDNLASSVLGYVSSINDTQKEKYELKGYDVSSDLIGTSGIESAFEDQLKGVKGGKTVKVNSKGGVTETLFQLESYPGNDVHLTLDSNVQYAAEQGLKDAMEKMRNGTNGDMAKNATRGALVAVDVKTGKVLSLVSYPDFNPNLFTVSGQLTSDEYKSFFNPDLEAFGKQFIQKMGLNTTVDDLFPLSSDGTRIDKYDLYPKATYNYATMSRIPPGSTFKPITSVAGIESGAIQPDTVINDTGDFSIHPETFGKNFHPSGLDAPQGPITLQTALEKSINFYFYETAYLMYKQNGSNIGALDSIAKYAWQFGLGVDPNDPNSKSKASTGIEIAENFGQTYNFTSWKKQRIAMSKYNLVDALEKGEYNGVTFIPFDFSVSDDDNDEVKNSKKAIKDKVENALNKVGVDDGSAITHDQFAKDVKKDIKNIMDHSDKYKSNVAKYEQDSGKKVNLDAQVNTIAEEIAQFTINDEPGQIKTPAEIVNASIGQGMNNFTPLQLVSYISTLANGGTRYKLHLVDEITDGDGNVVQKFNPEVLNTVQMSQSTQKVIREGMKAVNNEAEGTAKTAFEGFPIETAGKTGTADVNQEDKGRKPYAVYASYAPADDPQIAVVAVVFDGGHGASVASAVRAVYDAYFEKKLEQEQPGYVASSAYFKKYVLNNPNRKKEDGSSAASTDANTSTTTNNSKNTDLSAANTNSKTTTANKKNSKTKPMD
ncbi:penicillin-binding transpeptidase domain-containing protein [Clostridium saccharobutylicum]|uniref:Penicillin-binding protein 2 n=1 Tax=Clostridium saccharobutylicum DSM 13864 TaxID=1345695 RepID=U5MM75_CLOSA|nr:penicillin-binding transpeptidase domain-containing protein [Clostridium saccharobutylicum]AGX41628.1 penicillin-binding protein 2 [Clostridium saccharobutylicum DSM 13864]AQR88910.1 penicillin-binding protein 2B [Clostridium saccharobutylicum]AQR98811.1 penicillin-binding protein 2B [Clostridium saccharobutylicum]AQS12799.1 penicillin-binding protein 2B [Clostridium saccharobutylicum]MBA2904089.1 penicillin-binding protein 2 [Clostridium saccharobutylicum]